MKHLLGHLELHDILTNKQHGFRLGHSCESQLLITTHDLLASADEGDCVHMAILGFSTAFDMVPNCRLMSKLDFYGIRGNIHTWISTFLMNRKQSVVIKGFSSPQITVDYCVSQGTALK